MRLSSGAYAAGALLDAVESGVRARQVELQVAQALGLSLDLGAFGKVDEELALLASTRTAVATGRDLLLDEDGDRYLLRLGAMLDEAEHTARSLEALLISGSLEGRLPLERLVAIWARAAAFQTCFVAASLRSAEQRADPAQVTRYRDELAEAEVDRRTAETWVARVAQRPDEEAWLEIFERARLLPRRLRAQVSEIDEVISLCRTYIRRKKRGQVVAPLKHAHQRDVIAQPRRSSTRQSGKVETKRASNPAVEAFRDRRPCDDRAEGSARTELRDTSKPREPGRPRRNSNPRLEPLITPKSMPVLRLRPVEVDPLVEEIIDAMVVGPAAIADCVAKAGSRLDAEVLRQLISRQVPEESAGHTEFATIVLMLSEIVRKKARPRGRACELAYQLLLEASRVVVGEAACEILIALAAAQLARPSTDRAGDAERAATLLAPLVEGASRPAPPRVLLLVAEASLRMRGDRSALVESCLALCDRALQQLGPEARTSEWATAQMLRGDALRERARGKRCDNLEEAIAAYREALARVRKDEQLDTWAQCKLGVGLAYALRQTGEPKDNQLRAIENLTEAVSLLDETARLELALGRLHLARLLQRRGLDGDTLRIGELYELAVKVFTAKDHPNEYQLCHDGIDQLRRPKRIS